MCPTFRSWHHRADMCECEFCYDHLTWHDGQLNLHAVSYLLVISNHQYLMTNRHFDWAFNADTPILQIGGIVLFHCSSNLETPGFQAGDERLPRRGSFRFYVIQ